MACALFRGAQHVERVDALIERIARQRGIRLPELHRIVTRVDDRLRRNRAAAAIEVDGAVPLQLAS